MAVDSARGSNACRVPGASVLRSARLPPAPQSQQSRAQALNPQGPGACRVLPGHGGWWGSGQAQRPRAGRGRPLARAAGGGAALHRRAISEQRLERRSESGGEKPQEQPVARPSVRTVGAWAAVTGPRAGEAASCPIQRGCLPLPGAWIAHPSSFQRCSLAVSERGSQRVGTCSPCPWPRA